jgi:hypothetical protein
LPPIHRAVQLGHAVIESTKNFPYEGSHPYLIVFGCKTEKSLKNAIDFCRQAGIMVVEFREPDRNNELTAFATATQSRNDDTQKMFRKYQLLKE